MLVPFFDAHNQNTFCTQVNGSPFRSTLLTLSCPPTCDLPHLPRLFLESSRKPTTLVLHIVIASSCFASASTPHAPFLTCCRTPLRSMLLCFTFLFTDNHFSFGFGVSSSQSFHRRDAAVLVKLSMASPRCTRTSQVKKTLPNTSHVGMPAKTRGKKT